MDSTSKSDVTDFVKYLLDGSGAESQVDFAALRKDLEGNSMASSNNILEGLPAAENTSSYSQHATREHHEITSPVITTTNQQQSHIRSTSTEILSSSLKYLENVKQSRKSSNPTEKTRILTTLSNNLVSQGFPPLPVTLLTGSTFSTTQITALEEMVTQLLEKHTSQANTLAKLQSAYALIQESLGAEQRRVVELEESHRSSVSHDSELLASLERSLRKSTEAERELSMEVDGIRGELQRVKRQCETYRVSVMDQDSKIRDLEFELEAQKLKAEKKEERAEQIFEEMTGKAAKKNGGVDRIVLSVIQSYEKKLLELTGKGSIVNTRQERSRQTSEDEITEFLSQKLEVELESTRALLQETQTQLELLKLSHIDHQIQQIRDDDDRTQLTTRQLIQRDKKSHNVAKTVRKTYSDQQLVDLVKHVCQVLNVEGIEDLRRGLDDVGRTIRLIPQLQSFISRIDELLYGVSNAESSDDPGKSLTQVLRDIERLVVRDRENNAVVPFLRRVQESCGVEDLDKCLKVIRSGMNSGIASEMMSLFQRMFDIPDKARVSNGIKDLYLYKTQVDSGLRGIERSFGIGPGECSVSRLLASAARVVEINGGEVLRHDAAPSAAVRRADLELPANFSLNDSFVE